MYNTYYYLLCIYYVLCIVEPWPQHTASARALLVTGRAPMGLSASDDAAWGDGRSLYGILLAVNRVCGGEYAV